MRFPSLALSSHDRLSLEGLTLIFGVPAAGKSTSSYAHLLRAALGTRRHPASSLVILIPTGEHLERVLALVQACGRQDDLILLRAHGHRFNMLQWARRYYSVETMTAMLMQAADIVGRGGSVTASADATSFRQAAGELLSNALRLLTLADEQAFSLLAVHRAIASAPGKGDLERTSWQASSYCAALLAQARARAARSRHPLHRHELRMAEDFWRAWSLLGERLKSAILNTFTVIFSPLLHGELFRLFSTDTTFDLAWGLDHHKIFVLDLPTEEFGEGALYVQAILKYCVQLAIRRRPVTRATPPVGIIADEYQLYATASDLPFLAVARNKGAFVVGVCHSLSELYDKLGREAGEALVSYARTCIYHALDTQTARFAANQIGQNWQTEISRTTSRGATLSGEVGWFWNVLVQLSLGEFYGISRTDSVTAGEKYAYRIEPSDFTSTLRNGGPQNAYLVDAIVFQSSKTWSNGANHLRVTFRQDFARQRFSLRFLLRA